MKKSLKPMKCAGLFLVSTLTFIACSEDENDSEEVIMDSEVISISQLQYSDESEQLSDDIAEIVEDVYTVDEISSTSKGTYLSDYLPDCAMVSTVAMDNIKEKTIDFGEGCELQNGNILSGVIKLIYAIDMEAASKTITVQLDNFKFNSVMVEGGASILRVRSNENGNPQSRATRNYKATWPDGEIASFTGNRTREWIEGYGTGFWGDNVFLITGDGTFTNQAGGLWTKIITTPLRREQSCRFIVSGVLEISRNGTTASLDFGDGECNAKGLLTKPDGSTEEILLRRFLRN